MNVGAIRLLLPRLANKLGKNFNTMQYQSLGNHIERTSLNTREEIISEAVISNIYKLSPTVKGLDLTVENPNFSFKAGQWVDVFIPNENQVGGFSMCSAPSVMKSDSKLQLAIKYSSWPPSNWVHKRGKVGDKLAIRAGGDFFYDPPLTEKMPNLTLIAGGVGINPLLSILLHLSTKLAAGSNVENFPEHMTLLYSAKSKEEILFQDIISDLKTKLRSFTAHYFVTGKGIESNDTTGEEFQRNRISDADLLQVVRKNGSDSLYFMCGPPPMIDHCQSRLVSMGVAPDRILFEKWW